MPIELMDLSVGFGTIEKVNFFLGPTMFIATCKQHVALFIYSKIPWPKWEMVE